MNKRKRELLLFLMPVGWVIFFLIIKIFSNDHYQMIIQEDAVFESLQSLFFLISAILAVLISAALIKKKLLTLALLYGIICLGFIFIAGEEISWGQRIFKKTTPAFFIENNAQKEISVHNLEVFQPHLNTIYILIGFYGTFSWILLKKIRIKHLHFFYPDWYLSTYFFFTLLIYAYFEFIGPFAVNILKVESLMIERFFVWRDQEPVEFILAAGFMFFTMIKYRQLYNNRASLLAQALPKHQDFAKSRDAKIQRNALCPCGSGKKYKKCCLK